MLFTHFNAAQGKNSMRYEFWLLVPCAVGDRNPQSVLIEMAERAEEKMRKIFSINDYLPFDV